MRPYGVVRHHAVLRFITFGLIGVVALFGSHVASAAPVFMGLGELPGGILESRAFGISADGSTIVGDSRSATGLQAFRWRLETGMVGLGDLPGGAFEGTGIGVSADGSVVVGSSSSTGSTILGREEAFRWTAATGMVGLGDLPGGVFLSEAFAAPNQGAMVVGYGSRGFSSDTEAFRWTQAGGMIGLGDLPAGLTLSAAFDASADGNVVIGRASDGQYIQAAKWSLSTGWVGLGVLPGHGSSGAQAVSSDGQTIVGWSSASGDGQAIRWTANTGMIALGNLPGGVHSTYATDVSDDGDVIVGYGIAPTGLQSFIWNPVNGIRFLDEVLSIEYGLNLSGWALSQATGVSGDGRLITGFGTNPSGQTEAWIAIIPEPNTLILLMLGAAGFPYSCNKKKRR